MFVDLVNLTLKAGSGGDGIVAFRREKYVPMGGPAGGSGGRGGSIIFVGDEGLSTLLELRYNKKIVAEVGEKGMPKGMHGKNADDLKVRVPVGTTIFDIESGKVLADITEHKQEAVIAKAGRGGRGNIQFATSKHPAPEICEKGEPGQELEVRVELKLLADVGLVGYPSVGKSTLISVISKARPKIANYHFTTITPNLGVAAVNDKSFVVADLPGLIEGAAQGAGLGYQFLRHIERTKVIIHVIDVSGSEGRDPIEDFHKINKELRDYDESLLLRPQVVALNKSDLPTSEENIKKFKDAVKDYPIVEISSITKAGVQDLLYVVADVLEEEKERILYKKEDYVVDYTFEGTGTQFKIELAPDNVYEIKGEVVEKLFKMTDFSKDQSVKRFGRQLRALGVDAALRDRGLRHGDVVRILDFEFDFLD